MHSTKHVLQVGVYEFLISISGIAIALTIVLRHLMTTPEQEFCSQLAQVQIPAHILTA